jgi:hypothetical protein
MHDTIDLKYDEIMAQTERAILFRFDNEEVWLPRSQIEDPNELDDCGGEVSVQYWIVKEKELEGYEV